MSLARNFSENFDFRKSIFTKKWRMKSTVWPDYTATCPHMYETMHKKVRSNFSIENSFLNYDGPYFTKGKVLRTVFGKLKY
jgi:hypothetical protein